MISAGPKKSTTVSLTSRAAAKMSNEPGPPKARGILVSPRRLDSSLEYRARSPSVQLRPRKLWSVASKTAPGPFSESHRTP